MRLTEAWNLSRVPYREVVFRSLAEERGRMWWGAFGKSRFDEEGRSDFELTKRVLRIAKFDKLLVAVFCGISSVMPFSSLFFGSRLYGLASSIALSLAVTFGFIALYAIQTFSSFVSPESMVLLSTLPLSRDDLSRVTLFSFLRSVDYMVVGSIVSQVVLVAFLTVSPVATLLMFVASVMNAVFAVAVALWFSKVFYRNLMRGGRSRKGAVLRVVFVVLWGSLLLGVGLLLSIPWYVVPRLEMAFVDFGQFSSLLFFVVYPFSAGISVANLVNPSAAYSAVLAASVAMIGYLVLAGVAGRWVLGTVKQVSLGAGVKIARVAARDFSVKPRGPVMGYIVKDLKTSSRNPATAFFFALPVLETLIVSLLIASFQVLKVSAILVATSTSGIFALLMPLALLNAEGAGLEYTKTLPVTANRIIVSKALVSTATYVPVPLTVLVLSFVKQLTSPLAVLLAFFTMLAIASASVFEIKLFLCSAAKGRIAAVIRDAEKLALGVLIILLPVVAYAASYLVSFDHVTAVLAMGAVAVSELAVAYHVLNRS